MQPPKVAAASKQDCRGAKQVSRHKNQKICMAISCPSVRWASAVRHAGVFHNSGTGPKHGPQRGAGSWTSLRPTAWGTKARTAVECVVYVEVEAWGELILGTVSVPNRTSTEEHSPQSKEMKDTRRHRKEQRNNQSVLSKEFSTDLMGRDLPRAFWCPLHKSLKRHTLHSQQ